MEMGGSSGVKRLLAWLALALVALGGAIHMFFTLLR
jgi:hypothetical protein